MSDKLGSPAEGQTDEHKEKYFNFQIKGWTKFDPMDKTLTRIAESIARGGGFLTLVEVLKVEDDLACIGDEEVRECFANILAAERLVRTVHQLPKNLIEDLRSALKAEEEGVPKKTVASVANLPVTDAKRWP
jgi:hypothetical protein